MAKCVCINTWVPVGEGGLMHVGEYVGERSGARGLGKASVQSLLPQDPLSQVGGGSRQQQL